MSATCMLKATIDSHQLEQVSHVYELRDAQQEILRQSVHAKRIEGQGASDLGDKL